MEPGRAHADGAALERAVEGSGPRACPSRDPRLGRRWSAAFAEHETAKLRPGARRRPHRGAYDVLTEDGEIRARLPGRGASRRRTVRGPGRRGLGRARPRRPGAPAITAVLPRRTKFSRRAAHDPGADVAREQVVAANVDVVFVDRLARGRAEPARSSSATSRSPGRAARGP